MDKNPECRDKNPDKNLIFTIVSLIALAAACVYLTVIFLDLLGYTL